ncbi:MAG: hypothetical protein AAF399_19100, partial [Bacteroidota bacterium]
PSYFLSLTKAKKQADERHSGAISPDRHRFLTLCSKNLRQKRASFLTIYEMSQNMEHILYFRAIDNVNADFGYE